MGLEGLPQTYFVVWAFLSNRGAGLDLPKVFSSGKEPQINGLTPPDFTNVMPSNELFLG
jgi:hypothetical protein